MTAEIHQIRDYQSHRDLLRAQRLLEDAKQGGPSIDLGPVLASFRRPDAEDPVRNSDNP